MGIPNGPRWCAVTACAAVRVHLRDGDARGIGRASGEYQLSEPKLLGGVIEFHRLHGLESALPGVSIERHREACVRSIEDHSWIPEGRALKAATVEHERVAGALRSRQGGDQFFNTADALTAQHCLQRREVEYLGLCNRSAQQDAEQQADWAVHEWLKSAWLYRTDDRGRYAPVAGNCSSGSPVRAG